MATFNFVLITWFFSCKMEMFKVPPIFKKSGESSVSNLMPISICPCVSKFLERITHHKLQGYLNLSNVLLYKKFGILAVFSTSMSD